MDQGIFGRYFAKGTGKNWERGWITDRRRITSGDWKGFDVQATLTLHYLQGNSGPYVAVTGEIRDPRKKGRGEPEGCGCCHDEIALAFPELAPLIRIHLSTPAEPMHYVANAIYWAEFVAGISKWKFDEYGQFARAGRTALDVFNDHIVSTPEDDTAFLTEPIDVKPPKGVISELFADSPEGKKAARVILAERVTAFCVGRADRMKQGIQDVAQAFRLSLSEEMPTKEERAGACPIA